jgi:hypothetical protein
LAGDNFMSAANLSSLLKRVLRERQGGLKEGPEQVAFIDALVATKPLQPTELLDLAAALRSDPKRSKDADNLAFQALSAIAHDRELRKILSKIGSEVTPWGVTMNQLRARIMRAFRPPGSTAAGWLEISSTTGPGKVPEGSTLYFSASEAKKNGAPMFLAATCINGKVYVAPTESHGR